MPYQLEPIDDKDLDGESKFRGEGKTQEWRVGEKEDSAGESSQAHEQAPAQPERGAERKEQEDSASFEKILEKARQQAGSATASDDEVKSDVDSLSEVEEGTRVNRLIDLAEAKGAPHAFKVALKLDDFYAVDQLHDKLSGKLFEELVKKGAIKEL